jgi:hypothetical protein
LEPVRSASTARPVSAPARSGADIGVDASGNSQTKPRKNHTTGSGSANGGIKLDTK